VKKFSKKLKKSAKLSVYSNLSKSHKAKIENKLRKYSKYISSIPKNPLKKFLFMLKPNHFFKYWFSLKGLIMALKIIGVSLLLLCLLIGGIFVYFRKDLDAIRPGEINDSVQSTVNTYYDRNDNVLWEDKGNGNYKLVISGDQMNQTIKDATIAIEDRDFYKHNGVSLTGITRAFINNLGGGTTQGGSTLTQQLVKQVFFADEAQKRGISGIPRKIKELVLAIEVERMYSKEQILNLYLNESPYGGRRNGVESAAQTYFGKATKDLTLPEAALIAAIPQNPSLYNPYNINGHEALINRQHKVLNDMVEMGYITKDQAEEAKSYPIIDHIIPEATQYTNIRAPHFVQMVKAELENTLGKATVGKGGLKIKTTLDLRIQTKLEEAMNDMFSSSRPKSAGFSNGASTVEDVKTGQIVALMGSRDFNWPGYGQDNAATASIQPGSTVKPFVFAKLFEKRAAGQINFGSGSILKDENIDALYGAKVNNADRAFWGDLTIRLGLANSRNIPAIKAMYINGVSNTLDTIHKLGAKSYCTEGDEVNVGLASAIGGCGVQQVDLVNGISSLARMGVYKPQSTILEVKNNSGEILQTWADIAGEQIIDPQSAYIISDILTDDVARSRLAGRHAIGMEIPGVKTATKTGTSDRGGAAKDIWMMSYSPVLTMGVWLGNSDATTLIQGWSSIPGPIVAKVMDYAHKEVYAPQGLWKSGDWFTQPSGIQRVDNELYPSWWAKTQGQTKTKMVFDKVSKKKATDLTPIDARIELEVTKMIDPITKKDVFTSLDGYDTTADDDVHKATDVKPSATITITPSISKNDYDINVKFLPGTFAITSASILVNGEVVINLTNSGSYVYSVPIESTDLSSVTVKLIDSGLYSSLIDEGQQIPAYSKKPL